MIKRLWKDYKNKKKTDKIDYACGVMLNKQIGEKVGPGEILGVIFYNKHVDNISDYDDDNKSGGKEL